MNKLANHLETSWETYRFENWSILDYGTLNADKCAFEFYYSQCEKHGLTQDETNEVISLLGY